jgi:uncharacterized protein YdeI (YjbR/CyaY-like superfamily)
LLRYSYEQVLTNKPLKIEDLFHHSTLNIEEQNEKLRKMRKSLFVLFCLILSVYGISQSEKEAAEKAIPEDLKDALSKRKGATEFFTKINASSKRFVLRWIKLAKTDETRRNRLEKIALLSSRGEKLPGS